MALTLVLLTLLAAPGAAAELRSGVAASARPVSKVRTLLSDMVEQLEKEAKEDEHVYEEMACWCETGDKTKGAAIASNTDKVALLTDVIESSKAASASLSSEVGKLQKELAANTEALESATAMRKKELTAFSADESDVLQSIGSMKGALAALARHHESAASFLEARGSAVQAAAQVAQAVLARHGDLIEDALSSEQRDYLGTVLLQTGHRTAEPQSGAILGMLKGMKESFENNLAKSQKEETQNQADYESLKSAKDEEIAAGKNLIEVKTQELAKTDEKQAQASADLKATQATIDADSQFLTNLKEQCKNVDAEYAERTKTRQMEITAVGKALEYLSSDDAKDLVARTLGGAASFLQRQAATARRTAMASLLLKASARAKDPRLSLILTAVRNEAFAKVRKQLKAMIETLEEEKEEEIKHKDFCIDSIQKNEKDTDHKANVKADYGAVIDDLAMTVEELGKEIATLKAALKEAQVELKKAGEAREQENKDFQMTVADQRAAQKLLAGALNILKGFYDKMSLVQTGTDDSLAAREPAGPPPPAGFKKQENNAQSGGVMSMMQQIIDDAKAMEADALKAEEESQVAYETFVADTNASTATMQKSVSKKIEEQAKAKGEKVQKSLELDTVDTELDDLRTANAELHESCDWAVENFDARQKARDDEIQALKESIAIFSGGAFLEAIRK